MSQQYVVYSRVDCHLCDEMKGELLALQQDYDFEFEEVDIDGNAELVHQYGFFVPVLVLGDEKICHYHLDREAFLSSLSIQG